ncbi:hypothetical protein ACIRD3_13140 [Kitasatospora sp. NPDC093550]|uniref:hypothetical protein n=1 Tax=Kitasatospora sp. NPDC093550 TaxID=3364089 RepID=UPI0037FE296D
MPEETDQLMTPATDPLSGRWPLAPSGEADWLVELCEDGTLGFMPPGLPDAGWVLHAMYEHERGPGEVSYDEERRARLADGRARPRVLAGVDLDAVGVVTGGGLGRAEHPGPGWRRLRWAELAERSGDPVVAEGTLPCLHCFPSVKKNGSWPRGIVPPAEGSLDRETWNRLVAVLTAYSPDGPDTRCLAFYNPLMMGEFDHHHVRAGRLGDAELLYDTDDADFSPSNLWAADRSWVLCTDYDLWGTKVAGPPDLVRALLDDPELEVLRLPWTG